MVLLHLKTRVRNLQIQMVKKMNTNRYNSNCDTNVLHACCKMRRKFHQNWQFCQTDWKQNWVCTIWSLAVWFLGGFINISLSPSPIEPACLQLRLLLLLIYFVLVKYNTCWWLEVNMAIRLLWCTCMDDCWLHCFINVCSSSFWTGTSQTSVSSKMCFLQILMQSYIFSIEILSWSPQGIEIEIKLTVFKYRFHMFDTSSSAVRNRNH